MENENSKNNEQSAINSSILTLYCKTYGKNRNLKKYLHLTTSCSKEGDPQDLHNIMKSSSESSGVEAGAGDLSKKYSRKTSLNSPTPEYITVDEVSQFDEDRNSPPIIIEETAHISENESVRSGMESTLDTSINRAQSPTSSITSQKKLEWDPAGDIGCTDQKTSGSSLSTIERLVLKSQYSQSENKVSELIGNPTAHSTMAEPCETKLREKRKIAKTKSVKSKNTDKIELNIPCQKKPSSISFNVNKQISFNVDRDRVTIENVDSKITQSNSQPNSTENEGKAKTTESKPTKKTSPKSGSTAMPVYLCLHTLKKCQKRRKSKTTRRPKQKKKYIEVSSLEKSGDIVSNAESFKYVPGPEYNQKQHDKREEPSTTKQDLSGNTDSSKSSNFSFTTYCDKNIDYILRKLEEHNYSSELKQRLIKEFVTKMLAKKFDQNAQNKGIPSEYKRPVHSTTSTSDSLDRRSTKRKSVLRTDRFKLDNLPSTSHSAPNLLTSSNDTNIKGTKTQQLVVQTDTDYSSKAKDSSDSMNKPMLSSEKLYQQYLEARQREELYKKHLQEKKMFIQEKQIGIAKEKDENLKDLMKKLSCDDGSGDASNNINMVHQQDVKPTQRNMSVFTLSTNCKHNANRSRRQSPGSISPENLCCFHDLDKKNNYVHRVVISNPHQQPCVDTKDPNYIQVYTDNLKGEEAKHTCNCCCARNNCANVPTTSTGQWCSNHASSSKPCDKCRTHRDSSTSTDSCKNQDGYLKVVKSSQTETNIKTDCGSGKRYRDQVIIEERIANTRWTQTNISLNPCKSEATITDVRIIDDGLCGLVTHEARDCCKNRKGSCSDGKNMSCQTIDTCFQQSVCSRVEKCTKNKSSSPPYDSCKSKSTTSLSNRCPTNKVTRDGDKYAIPLEGTNMTVVLSIDPNGNKKTDCNSNKICVDKTTSIHETCTKALASETRRTEEKTITELRKRTIKQGGNRFNTYPAAEKYGMCRSNTCGAMSNKDEIGKAKVSIKKIITSPKNIKTCKPERKDQGDTRRTDIKVFETIECTNRSEESDPAIQIIRDITKRYTKKLPEKEKRKKCVKEIISLLKYLLDTEGSTTDDECLKHLDKLQNRIAVSKTKITKSKPCSPIKKNMSTVTSPRKCASKCIQISSTRINNMHDMATGSNLEPSTSSDSTNCELLKKAKCECERKTKKHKPCKHCNPRRTCPPTACDMKQTCSCGKPQCPREMPQKCLAYNLIIQPSDSLVSEDLEIDRSPLENVVVKVPSKKCCPQMPFQEVATKIENYQYKTSSRQCLNDETNCQSYTVRDYLEKNRPDFIEKTASRQSCLKVISESRANERATARKLLSLQMQKELQLNDVSARDIRRLAKELGAHMRRKKAAPKFISEKEMKRHSENIYKSLPEVTRKKEEARKENIKRTNLLMANLFKKNLQRKTLHGSVNLSNYNAVLRI